MKTAAGQTPEGVFFHVPRQSGQHPKRALAFVFAKNTKGGICLTQHPTPPQNAPNRGPNPGRWLYAWFAAASLSPLLCRPAHAATIWSKASDIMKDVYTQILGISTIAAVVTAAVALLMINFGHTDRSTQEARSWLKRIIITWMILNSLGFIMAYITPFFSGGQWTPS